MGQRLDVGQGTTSVPTDHFAAGRDAAREALDQVKLPPQLALVFACPELATEGFLQGVKEGLGGESAPPMVGCTTPFPVAAGGKIIGDGAVVTVLAAAPQDLHARVGVGLSVDSDPLAAVKAAVDGAHIRPYAEQYSPGFVFAITSGFRYDPGATVPGPYDSAEVLRLLAEEVTLPLTVFGGAAADRFQRTASLEFAQYQLHQNAVALAFVETRLAFGCSLAYGLEPNGNARLSIDRLRGGTDEGKFVELINGEDAWPLVERLAGGETMLFMIGDALHGRHHARPFYALDDPARKTLYFPRVVSRYTYLRAIAPNRAKMVASAREAAHNACLRSDVRQPAVAFVASCIGRAEIFNRDIAFAKEEASALLQEVPSTLVAGFYGTGEHAAPLGQDDASVNYGVGVLVLGDHLSDRELLGEKLKVLAQVGAQAQIQDDREQTAERVLSALNEVGYKGGMISLVRVDEVTHQRFVKSRYARSAPGVEWNRWEEIAGEPERDLDGDDILALVVDGRAAIPQVIPDSRRDKRCEPHAVEKGDIRGQIIFPLLDPGLDDRPYGALQIGIDAGYEPIPIELEALAVFAGTAAHLLAVSKVLEEIRGQLLSLYTLSSDIAVGEGINELLQGIVTGAAEALGADYASLRLVDKEKSHLVFRAFHPCEDQSVWTRERRKMTMPVGPVAGGGHEHIGQKVFHEQQAYLTDDERNPYFSRFLPGVTGQLSVPVTTGGEPVGVLTVNKISRHFDPAHSAILSLFGRLVAAAVTNGKAQLRSQVLGRLLRIFMQPRDMDAGCDPIEAQLSESALLVKEALHCGECSLFLVDSASPRQLVLAATTSAHLGPEVGKARYRIGQGLTGGIAALQRPLRLSRIGSEEEMREFYPDFVAAKVRWTYRWSEWAGVQYEKDTQFLGVPIVWREKDGAATRLLGVVRCTKKVGAEHFFPDDQELLETIASHVAVGLQQAHMISELAAREEWQRHFVALSSHQLRSPITYAVNKLDRLVDSLDADQQRVVSECQWRLNRLRVLLDNLRLLQQLQGDLTLLSPVEGFGIRSMVENAIREVESDFTGVGMPEGAVRVVYRQEEPDLAVDGYPVFLGQAVMNLLSNAIKASPAEPIGVVVKSCDAQETAPTGTFAVDGEHPREVTAWQEVLRTDSASSVVLIQVMDSGVGIAKENLVRIFQPLTSLGDDQKREGFGLGLTLVQRIARAHGGDVTVWSRLGEGSVFTLVLPKEG